MLHLDANLQASLYRKESGFSDSAVALESCFLKQLFKDFLHKKGRESKRSICKILKRQEPTARVLGATFGENTLLFEGCAASEQSRVTPQSPNQLRTCRTYKIATGSPQSLDDIHASLRCSASRLSAKLGRAVRKMTCKEKIPCIQQGLRTSERETPNVMLNPRQALSPFTNSPEAPNFDKAKKRPKTQATTTFLSVETRDSYTRLHCPRHQDRRPGGKSLYSP